MELFMETTVFFFLATLLATSHATCLSNPIRLPRDHDIAPDAEYCISNKNPASGSRLGDTKQICQSWRFSVETNNRREWSTIPAHCVEYIGEYMLGDQYRKDCNYVVDIAMQYAQGLQLKGDGKEVWIFDIEETTLSNIPYYSRADVSFGAFPHNNTKFNDWVSKGASPAVPGALRLYEKFNSLGIKIVFLTGIHEYQKYAISLNLKLVGFKKWEKFILKSKAEYNIKGAAFKSKKRKELVDEGYRIVGNIGDQWSDLTGEYVGNRTFKMPNPMYYS